MPKILIINGQNVGIIGRREPNLYGSTPLAEGLERCERMAAAAGVEIEVLTSNHEGELIDRLHEITNQDEGRDVDAILVNPGGLTPYGLGLRDALKTTFKPVVLVHVSNRPPKLDGPFRHVDIIAPVAMGNIVGLGVMGYELAVAYLLREVFGHDPL